MPNNLSFLSDTVVTGLLSHPVKHSFSPSIHNTSANILGMNFVYLAFDVCPENLENALSGMKALNIRGFNLSLPHKKKVLPFLDFCNLEVKYTGAANTIVNNNGILSGFNTDIFGFTKSLEVYEEFVKGKPAFIVGAGGGASAAIYSLIVNFKIKKIFITNRTLKTASALVFNFVSLFKDVVFEVIPFEDSRISKALTESGLIINTTSIGMSPSIEEMVNLPFEVLKKDSIVYDIVYNPLKTRFLEEAEKQGCVTINGLYMLLFQAAESFKIWTGKDMPVEEVKKLLPQFS
jgi:shikimate dehydrogenase